jgi:hypothetical protein
MTTKHHDVDWDKEGQDKHETAKKSPPAEGKVRVRCISHAGPWTDTKSLAHGEEADVSPEVAKILKDRKLVEDA